MFFRRICVLALVFCMVLTLLPSALAAVEMPQWAIDEGLTEEEYLERIEKEKEKEKEKAVIPEQPPQPLPVVEAPIVEAPVVETPVIEALTAEASENDENALEELAEAPAETVVDAEPQEAEAVEEAAEEAEAVEEVVEEAEAVEEVVEEIETVEEVVEEAETVEEAIEEAETIEEVVEEPEIVEEVVEEAETVEEAAEEAETVEEAAEEAETVEEAAEEAETVEEVVEEAKAVEEAEVDGYTVEFRSADGREFVLQGDASAPLKDILSIIGHGDIDVSQIAEVVSTDEALFSAEQDENGVWVIKANKQFATDQKMTLVMADGSIVEISVTDDCNVAEFDGHSYQTLEEAFAAANGSEKGGIIKLLENIDSSNVVLNVIKDIIIDFDGHFINVKKDIPAGTTVAAKFEGGGSLTLTNGTLESTSQDIETVVESSVSKLTLKDMLIKGLDTIKGAVLSIVGGEVEIEGNTSIDSGKNENTAITVYDASGDTSVLVNTRGVILGQVAAKDTVLANATEVLLHNGYFSGKVVSDGKADVRVDGGDYLRDVNRYVGRNTDYAAVSNLYGTVFSAGANLPWTALDRAVHAPTFINVLKSDGAVVLPVNTVVKNSVWDKCFIFLNGKPLLRGAVTPVPQCGPLCCGVCAPSASVVDGGDSIWYKGCRDGLTYELSGDISYVTIDGERVEAEIDGVYAELDAETFEELKAGTHTVRFVLKNGAAAAAKLKIVPDEEVVWNKGSENGLRYEMTGKIKKVLLDHVKVEAELDGKDASVSASVLQDLKTGAHTFEFVLENHSHVVTGFTVE